MADVLATTGHDQEFGNWAVMAHTVRPRITVIGRAYQLVLLVPDEVAGINDPEPAVLRGDRHRFVAF